MKAQILSVTIYMLGFIGIVSIGLLPLRSWQLMKIFRGNVFTGRRKLLALFAALISASVMWADVQVVARIFKCLTGAYCGPGIASGWSYLAWLGVVYFAFEAIAFILFRINLGLNARANE